MPTVPIDLAHDSTGEQDHRCYSASLDVLYDHALEEGGEAILADVLTHTLARMIARSETPIVAGAILFKLGLYVRELAD